MKTSVTTSVLVVLCAMAMFHGSAHGSVVDNLVRELGSENEAQQIRARQLLPRHGVEAVPGLLVLIEHPKDSIWRAARNVLADIANEAAGPGRDEDRVYVVQTLLKTIQTEENANLRRELLRLLPIVTRTGDDIAGLGGLLEHAEWREETRASLSGINTPEAHGLLLDGLETGDTAFRVALMNTLAQLDYNGDMKPILSQLEQDPLENRAAAARVLFSSGSIQHFGLIERVLAAHSESFEAGELILDYGDRLHDSGGQWMAAMEAYKALTAESTNPVIQGAALARLGQRGDETAIPVILEVMRSSEELCAPGIAGLVALRGPVRRIALEQAFETLPETVRPMLYAPMAADGSVVFMARLAEAAQAGTPGAEAALGALIEAASPAAIGQLAARAQSDTEGSVQWLDQLQQLALKLEGRGNGPAAGEAWLAVYQHGLDPGTRAAALDGIKRHPSPGAFQIVFDHASDEELLAVPASLLLSVVFQLEESAPEHARAMDLLQRRLNETAAVQAFFEAANGAGKGAWGAATAGVLTKWQLAGPFPWAAAAGFGPDPFDPAAVDTGKPVELDGQTQHWQAHETGDALGMVNLMGIYGGDHVCAYAVARIEAPADGAAQLRVGSDDSVKAWVNGALVHENLIDRGFALDNDIVPVQLKAGANTIVLKIGQNAGGWAFGARLTDADGYPLKFEYIE